MKYFDLKNKIIGMYSGILEESEREAELLLSYKLDKKISECMAINPEIHEDIIDNIIGIAKKRAYERIPLAYLLGKWHFYGLELYINKNVLIPRRETEQLIELILIQNDNSHKRLLDIGSGSGCISIALGKNRSNWNILGIDISKEAIAVSNENLHKFDCKNIEFKTIDVLNSDISKLGEFDIIVSNPPYIPEKLRNELPIETLKEPERALFAGDEGLIFYETIKNLSKDILKKDGSVYFEIDPSIVNAFFKLFKGEDIQIVKDYSGNERMALWKKH